MKVACVGKGMVRTSKKKGDKDNRMKVACKGKGIVLTRKKKGDKGKENEGCL